ncbi:hypothetical protein ACKC9G_02430 [Pokkaliibacter sp. CJK22405]|uniref:hypothetical protein n=1 Tax=Pokkaliibacter sp. CJK22405 TaxID=3384615 RepID=UPI00398515BC
MADKLAGILEETRVLEIVELESGELLLQIQEESEALPLIRLNITSEMKEFMGDDYAEMAREMLTAGVHAITERLAEKEEKAREEERPKILH